MQSAARTLRFIPAHKIGPDYTLPLRMQAAGRSAKDRERLRIQRMLWLRALRDRFVWKQAIKPTVGLGAGQMLLLRSLPGHHFWMMGLIPLTTLMAAITSSAATSVKSHFSAIAQSRN